MNTANQPLNDRRTINAWALFDWANSAYSLVITVAIFPGYFLAVTNDRLTVGGLEMSNSTLYSYAISAAYILIALASPILSGIADYGGRKKVFLRFFTTMGSLACIVLWWFRGMDTLTLGTVSFILATVGFAGGQVFYNSYLPVIASVDRYDAVSAKGFSYGYLGSVLLLVVNLLIIQFYESLGFKEQGDAVRLAFVMVGMWWIGFAQIPFRRLPADRVTHTTENLLRKGYLELMKVFRSLGTHPNTYRFLLAFFLFNAGVQTVLFLAATFAEKELHFLTSEMIILILLLQIVAIGGAYLFAKMSEWRGNKTTLLAILVIWIVICVLAYFVVAKMQFYALACGVGLVMGGIQSLSRSTYSKLLPENTSDTASWFSFFEVTDKLGVVMGTFGFGFIEYLTGSMRNSVLLLALFFVLGILILTFVKIEKPAANGEILAKA
jgi:UMF1 family MFS transporter